MVELRRTSREKVMAFRTEQRQDSHFEGRDAFLSYLSVSTSAFPNEIEYLLVVSVTGSNQG